jgi:tetratricopeptide (TPR) repeat protein
MSDFATRLMQLNENQSRNRTASAIFGSMGDIQRNIKSKASLRVGMWPCISENDPVVAMGLWSVLAYLLERWADIRVYRIFVHMQGNPDDFTWSIDSTQFEIDDWIVERLDENIAMWGTLTHTDGILELTATIENDVVETEETVELSVSGKSIGALVQQLPDFSSRIADAIQAERLNERTPVYQIEDTSESGRALFKSVIEWESRLLLSLWGVEWSESDIMSTYQDIFDAAKQIDGDFGAWVLAQTVSQTLRPGYQTIGSLLTDKFAGIVRAFPDSAVPAIILSPFLYRAGQASESLALLQIASNQTDDARIPVQMAFLYGSSERIPDAIAVLQESIQKNIESNLLYRHYGNWLVFAHRYDERPDLILTDQGGLDAIIQEAIAAYDRALIHDPDDKDTLQAKLLHMTPDDNNSFWAGFRHLVELDNTGQRVRDVIDNLYDIEDITPGIRIFEEMMREQGERFRFYQNLALLLLVNNRDTEAIPYLENALKKAEAIEQKADIERLMLTAASANFEYRFGELAAIVDAGNRLTTEDVAFLESVVESAPHLLDGYLLLGKAYAAWDDLDAALDTLLDAGDKLPPNPDVMEQTARYLWESGEKELAFDYLNRSITQFPQHIPSIVRVARYLFDNNQLDEARDFLAHAEEIEPRSPLLQKIRAYISRNLSD